MRKGKSLVNEVAWMSIRRIHKHVATAVGFVQTYSGILDGMGWGDTTGDVATYFALLSGSTFRQESKDKRT